MKLLRYGIWILAGSILYGLVLALCHSLGVAHAAALTDPPVAPLGDGDVGWSMIQSYGLIWGGMALAMSLGRALLKQNSSTHWIAQGRTLAIFVAVIGIGTAAVQAHLGGAAWSGVLITAIIAAFKLLQPVVNPPATPGSSGDPPSQPLDIVSISTKGLVFALLVGLVVVQPGCGSTMSQRATVLSAASATVDAGSRMLERYDAERSAEAIVAAKAAAAAPTLEQGKAMLAAARDKESAYVAKRNIVEKALDAACHAILAAVTVNDEPSLAGVEKAAADAAAAVTALTGGKP
jgi:hypothetical protein